MFHKQIEEEIVTNKTTYAIKDEKGNYVHGNSIKKINEKYYYSPYACLEDGCIAYTNKIRVEEAMDTLKLHNKLGGLGHKFIITFVS